MLSRIRLLAISAMITSLIISLAVLTFYFLDGGSSFYEAGRILLIAGIALTVFVLPLFYRSHHRARIRIHLHLPIEERNKLVSDPYYDVFAGVALGTIVTTMLGYGLVATANIFERRQASNTSIPFVGSVRSELPNLYNSAHQWQSDAYLVELESNFGRQQDFRDYFISAEFRSSSKPSYLLAVHVTYDGNYVHNLYPGMTSMPLPITDVEWGIDSQEAVSIFAQDEGIRACLNYDQPKELTLTRLYYVDNSPVGWCLRINECYQTEQRTCINAVTGDRQ